MLEQLLTGFGLVLGDGSTLLVIVIGTIIGIVVGAIPGLTVIMALSLMIPFSFYMSPVASIAMLVALTKAGIYGGSVSAILIGAPGTPAAAATMMDGYALTKKGKAGKALKIGLYSSALSDTFSNIVLVLVAVPLAKVALKFGPPEFFSVILFSLTIVGTLAGKSLVKGLTSAAFGLLICIVGLDPMNATSRWNFNILELTEGFHYIPMMIGVFAIREIFTQGEHPEKLHFTQEDYSKTSRKEDKRVSWSEFHSCFRTIFRSAVIGTGIGTLPGLGASISAWLCYGVAKNRSKNPDEFGKGAIEGIAAAEAGNNAVDGANLIPLLTLGIPGSPSAAILLGAFMIHGISPGPLLFKNHGELIFSVFAASFIAIVCYFLLGYIFLQVGTLLLKIQKGILFPLVLMTCIAGSYAINNSLFDVYVMIGFGVFGYVMDKFGFHVAPLVIGFLLGPPLERAFRQSLIIAEGNPSVFLAKPISLIFLILTVLILVFMVRRRLNIRKGNRRKSL